MGSGMAKVSALLLAAALAGCGHQAAVQATAEPAVMTKAEQARISPERALQMLKEGNARFVSGKMQQRDLKLQVKTTGHEGQYPFASVVSCIDSRAAPSLVFDQGIGDLFTARVAGNFVNDDILGSLEYASRVAGSRVIVILGHTHCGAIKGACDNVALGNLTQLLAKLRPAVDATPTPAGVDRSSHNHGFVDAVAETNVRMTVDEVLKRSAVLREMAAKGEIKVVGAMLDVETGEVHFY